MNAIIYCTTNLVNGKKYIGYHKGNKSNYFGSGTHILRALKKYGSKNFVRDILQDGITNMEDLKEAEIYWIDYFGAQKSDLFYNIAPGGEGNADIYKYVPKTRSLEHRRKIGQSLLGQKRKLVDDSIIKIDRRTLKRSKETVKKTTDKIKKPCLQLSLQGQIIKEFAGLVDTAAEGFVKSKVGECCRGERKTHKGYKWKFK